MHEENSSAREWLCHCPRPEPEARPSGEPFSSRARHPEASRRQIKKLARLIDRWGIVLPIPIDAAGHVIDGWGLVEAAKCLGLSEVPAVTIDDLPEVELRALRQALNRVGDDADWNLPELAAEFGDLLQLDPEFDLTITGFEMGEIDVCSAAMPSRRKTNCRRSTRWPNR